MIAFAFLGIVGTVFTGGLFLGNFIDGYRGDD